MVGIIVDVIGYSAAIVGTLLMLPQLAKSLKTRKVRDISFAMLILYFINCVLWATYGFLINALPLLICNLIALAISIVLIIIKIKYNKN